MTLRDIYEAVLVEVNKEDSRSFTLEAFNYIANKTVLAFTNEKYTFYPANQQLSDDLRVLLKTQEFNLDDTSVMIDPTAPEELNPPPAMVATASRFMNTEYQPSHVVNNTADIQINDYISGINIPTTLPQVTAITNNTVDTTMYLNTIAGELVYKRVDAKPIVNLDTTTRISDIEFAASDYLHVTSCRVIWKVKKPKTGEINHLVFPAKRLTYDMLNAIENNTYLKPSPNRPYYQLLNNVTNTGVLGNTTTSLRSQNKPVFRIHLGKSNSFMKAVKVKIDYIKLPEHLELTDDQLYDIYSDSSQVLEFPDYLKNELVKKCTGYILEKSSDARTQTQPQFNQEMPAIPLNMQMGSSTTNKTT